MTRAKRKRVRRGYTYEQVLSEFRDHLKPGDVVRVGGVPAEIVGFGYGWSGYGAVVAYPAYGYSKVWVPWDTVLPVPTR